jgi:hypothetical protein
MRSAAGLPTGLSAPAAVAMAASISARRGTNAGRMPRLRKENSHDHLAVHLRLRCRNAHKLPDHTTGARPMTDNIATLRGFTRYVLADSDQVSLHLLIRPNTDLDSTFRAWDTDEQCWIKVNGWLFTIEDIEQEPTRPMPSDYRPYDQFLEYTQEIDDYMEGRHDNPHGNSSVAAQAWDRGSEFAMRVVRYSNS